MVYRTNEFKRDDMMDRILVVDDDRNIVRMISEFMKINNIKVIEGFSGKDALALMDDEIQTIILDINMDDINGLEVCREIRKKYNVPIIFLSAKTSQYDKVLGLGIGADDYVTKPFDPLELVARVKAQIRRYNSFKESGNSKVEKTIEVGTLKVLVSSHRIYVDGNEVNLSNTEYNLLIFFLNNLDTVLSRKQILKNVWDSDIYTENTVNTYVMRLRQKLEAKSKDFKNLMTIRGVGYIFNSKET
ncbi:response regulator transcription factor [Anaeromicrobium sediminis]|uniref:Stage 0 sporulation protein A homolog n=1 Tax=Anaeromicrobium sediminis TaxID=1478221 RepID=A0A267MM36_9FIRM|nr:response regulator transcription factor [Anaeromicrobium sediminis]PAB59820.1 hypothetical protein CCE28_07645 [Anaeromicrobium sediminis]